uniref:Uncharacterized protein n=1 Tax=Arundo donax TaxID=35708 RepID=A0A0A9BXP5_ARUDO
MAEVPQPDQSSRS